MGSRAVMGVLRREIWLAWSGGAARGRVAGKADAKPVR
jgi:hypothetical protein